MVRFETARVLTSAKPLKSNLSRAKRVALKSLKPDFYVLIFPSDKGNAMIIFTKSDHSDKINGLLQNQSHLPLSRDPTSKIERELTY